MTASTVIALGDERDTRFIVQTIPTDEGTCSQGNDSCGKPGVIAVRNTIDQQRPAERSTYRVTLCADHQAGAARMHGLWVADARQLQDPATRATFLTQTGATA
jgi:hypothetical protein